MSSELTKVVTFDRCGPFGLFKRPKMFGYVDEHGRKQGVWNFYYEGSWQILRQQQFVDGVESGFCKTWGTRHCKVTFRVAQTNREIVVQSEGHQERVCDHFGVEPIGSLKHNSWYHNIMLWIYG